MKPILKMSSTMKALNYLTFAQTHEGKSSCADKDESGE